MNLFSCSGFMVGWCTCLIHFHATEGEKSEKKNCFRNGVFVNDLMDNLLIAFCCYFVEVWSAKYYVPRFAVSQSVAWRERKISLRNLFPKKRSAELKLRYKRKFEMWRGEGRQGVLSNGSLIVVHRGSRRRETGVREKRGWKGKKKAGSLWHRDSFFKLEALCSSSTIILFQGRGIRTGRKKIQMKKKEWKRPS